MKKALSVLIIFALLSICLCGCGYEYHDLDLRAEYTREFEGTELTVYNWGEYISDGADGAIDVNREFEKLTGIKVNYSYFESNEEMYAKIKAGSSAYDIIIPSDYMIHRMIKENMLKKQIGRARV